MEPALIREEISEEASRDFQITVPMTCYHVAALYKKGLELVDRKDMGSQK